VATPYTFDPRELYGAFQIDAEEQLVTFYDRLAALRNRAPRDEDWTELFRAIHTVKGGAAILGLQTVADLAEAICQAIRRQRNQPAPSTRFWQTLEAATRALERLTHAAIAGADTPAEPIAAHVEQLRVAS
jgi:chemotaxis protein histidine kinase CheA